MGELQTWSPLSLAFIGEELEEAVEMFWLIDSFKSKGKTVVSRGYTRSLMFTITFSWKSCLQNSSPRNPP